MSEEQRWRTVIEEPDGSVSSTKIGYLVFVVGWFGALCCSGTDHVEAILGIGAGVFGIVSMNNRYQKRKEVVVETAKPTDNTSLKVDA